MRSALLLIGLSLASQAYAVDIEVDTTADSLLDDCTAAAGDCSLRGAITLANAGGGDRIVFDIPTSDAGYMPVSQHWRIATASDLPVNNSALVIDGYTQAGAMENTLTPDDGGSNAVLKIELRGAGAQTGLFGIGSLHVRGLAINGFTSTNVLINAPSGSRVEGCFIGTDISGLVGLSPNGNTQGIRLRGRAIIGGITPAARNVISGNGYIGIWDESGTTTTQPSIFQGNLIGLAADGITPIAGQDYGLYSSGAAEGAQIGGDSAAARNVFAGNETNAIYFGGNAASAATPLTKIQGNYFGTDWSGTLARPNGTFPASPSQPQTTINVFRSGVCAVLIGGDAPGEGNLIAHGAAAGVQVSSCNRAALPGNAFLGNRIGIDLSPSSVADGPTPNDANDGDEGGNRLQNTPVIGSVTYLDNGATIELAYRVDTAVANATYPLRIDIGSGQAGQMAALAMIDVYAAGEAQNVRTVQFPASALTAGALVLQATDAEGNASEFTSDALFDDDFEE